MTFRILLAVYAAARILEVDRAGIPMPAVVALHVLPPAIFTLLHGAKLYGWRGILTFAALCVAIGNLFENLGVRTGFPFGEYYFTGLMGPKIFAAPILPGLAYVGMAYLSWTLASVILGPALTGRRALTLPLLAALIMVAWDLAMDPVWATILRAWVFRRGGPYFGVPVSNFAGWYPTVYTIYQAFALYVRRDPAGQRKMPASYWREALLFYAVSAAGNLLLLIPQAGAPIVTGPAGARWRVSDIAGASALVTVLAMGSFSLWAWMRLGYPSGWRPAR